MQAAEKINAVIIDDEPPCIDSLVAKLNDHCPEVNIRQTCSSAAEGVKAIYTHRPHLVFLDVNMPGEDGFSVLQRSRDIHYEVIFTTAYDKYALRAFQFNALNYLLKPVSAADVVDSIKRFNEQAHIRTSLQQIESLLSQVHQHQQSMDKIAIPTLTGYRFIPIKNIIRLESDSNYTSFHLQGEPSVLVSKTLKEYEELLSAETFVRVHHGHLINLAHLVEYRKGQGGVAVMADGSEIEVSARKKADLLARLPLR
ncbi:MAG: response regulator transcription factor [Cyclobacteriaceae bacterium]|nr:response regulator transcription factor [Cyclobacteriaceae bacterium]